MLIGQHGAKKVSFLFLYMACYSKNRRVNARQYYNIKIATWDNTWENIRLPMKLADVKVENSTCFRSKQFKNDSGVRKIQLVQIVNFVGKKDFIERTTFLCFEKLPEESHKNIKRFLRTKKQNY